MRVAVRWADVAQAPVDDPSLATGERRRLETFVADGDRRRFVGARLLLRAAVAEQLTVDRSDVTLVQRCARCGGPHGRPAISVRGRRGPEVSFSHAGSLAVVAIARSAVGVDVEAGAMERRTWVRTEAVLKATGHGLDVDPSLVVLSSPEAAPALLGWSGPGRRPRVRLADIDLPDHIAAVARLGRLPLHLDLAELPLS